MKTYTMDAYELSMMPAFDFDASYRVDGSEGIAYRADRWQTEPDEDTEWSGIEIPTGMLEMHMIGDDRTFIVDPDDCEPIDGPVCSCGQIGCGWHGEDS